MSEIGTKDAIRATERLSVPEFSGEGAEHEVGKNARSYIRRVQAWLRSTRLPAHQRALALYTNLSAKAWVYAEELDIDKLGSESGMTYFLSWIQSRFMEVEVAKVSQLMADLFRRCRRKPEQSIRDFNMEFERMVTRLQEIQCDLPPTVKAWLYLDKLKISEHDEISILSSVGNVYDTQRLQQAALLQDRSLRHSGSDRGKFGGGRWAKSVHMTTLDEEEDSDVDGDPHHNLPEDELVDEETAMEHHSAYMAYQGAKAKYRDTVRGRGTDPEALKRTAEERLKLAKARSYCSVCKRRGHWHKDAECPANQQSKLLGKGKDGTPSSQSAQMCYNVFMTDLADKTKASDPEEMLAIVDTACTRSVAGYAWFERYYTLADRIGIPTVTEDVTDSFRFGASRIHVSDFAVWAWFGIQGKSFAVKVSIVQCDVPLLLSRAVLAGLGMKLDVAADKAALTKLGLHEVPLVRSSTGHPALEVSQFPDSPSPSRTPKVLGEIWIPSDAEEAYMVAAAGTRGNRLFYPKKLPRAVQLFLEDSHLISGQQFYTWWHHANQSRDFWVETDVEMIRIHVCARKDSFDPRKWQTTLHDLKHDLLFSLDGHRVTEVIPCLSEGLQVHRFEDSLEHEVALPHHGVWIGRSRFLKKQNSKPLVPINASAHLTMEDVQSRAGGRVAPPPDPSAPVVDGSRTSNHVAGAEEDRRGQGRTTAFEGAQQDVVAGAHGGVRQAQAGVAEQANPGCSDADDQGPQEHPRHDGPQLRALRWMDVPRGTHPVSSLGGGGGDQERERLYGSEAIRNLGQGEPGQPREEGSCSPISGLCSRPRSHGDDPSANALRLGGHDGLELEHGIIEEVNEVSQGPPRFGDGGRGGIHGPSSGKSSTGTTSGAAQASREAEGADSLNYEVITKDLEKYVFLTGDDEVTTDEEASDGDYNQEMEVGSFLEEEEYTMSDDDYGKNDGVDEEIEYKDTMSPGGSPRDKARRGQRQRRWERKSLGQKSRWYVKSQLGKLAQVLMVMCGALGTWANEVVGEPAKDFYTLFQSTHDHRGHGDGYDPHRVDCLEVFAGHCKISNAFAKRRRGVLQPRDLLFGHDLRQETHRRGVLQDIREHRPRLVWLAPPCTYWCNFSRLNYSPQERRRLRAREGVFINLIEEVIVLQKLTQGLVIIENPRTSDIWRHSSLARWAQDESMAMAQVDLCTYGLESSTGMPLRKGLSLLMNSPTMAQDLTRRCTGEHTHQVIQGKETARSAIYPNDFADAVVRCYDRWRVQPVQHVHMTGGGSASSQQGGEQALPQGADAITFKGKVNPTVAGVLRRVHQNLGHPPTRVLIKHLKIGGAPESVIRAAEQLVCRTCESTSRPHPHKTAAPVTILDFNEVIAIDVIWLDTAQSTNLPALNVVDVASTYQVVLPLKSTKAEEAAEVLSAGWFRWAGVPRCIVADLDSAFKGDFLNIMDQRAILVKNAAGQAHWQNGVAERHGETWKWIWAKLVEEHLVTDDELEEAVAAVCDSKNQLRNKDGYSPRQWVFGANPRLGGDLFDGENELSSLDASTADGRFARLQAIKNGAKAAFFQVQTKDAYKRALHHRSRVQPREFQAGDLVYFYREVMQGKTKKPSAFWSGPATIIGREGANYWVARGGRCLLCAPEHVREARHEEVSEALRLKLALREVHKLIETDDNEYMEVDESYVPEEQGGNADVEMEVIPSQDGGRPNPRQSPAIAEVASRDAAIRQAAKRNNLLDDVPHAIKKAKQQGEQQVMMMKRCISKKGKEKQLEKELPWGQIHPDERHLYREAESKQWKEHLDFQAVRPLSLQESAEVERTVPKDRILNSRFAYKDKNFTKRKSDPSIPPKPKARLCVSGQWDPDLGVRDLATDAPTVCRQSVLLALQLSLARAWVASVGDIRAAFLNGIPAPRKLYFRQPRSGMPTLEPGQLIEVLKGVFGLSTSPKLWWTKLSTDLVKLVFKIQDEELVFKQNPVDPCVFMLQPKDQDNTVRGLLLTHVDDLLLLTEPALEEGLHVELQRHFPIDEWDKRNFEYVGCEFECRPESIKIRQVNYATNRVDKVELHPEQKDDEKATREQLEENRTSIGSVSWLSKQTRPDLLCAVSQAQRVQGDPTVKDLKQTNKLVEAAIKHKDCGISLNKIEENDLCIIAYHDAAWGNAKLDDAQVQDEDWLGEHQVASQLGALVVAADKRCLADQPGTFSLLHWQSKGCKRVCRSTFAGETMACSDAIESGIFLRGLLVSMMKGYLVPEGLAGKYVDFHCITDCKSLYDHTHREGAPKAPADKRLSIDLAAIRQVLAREGRHQWEKMHNKTENDLVTPELPCRPPLHWLPTGEQLADILTKVMKSEWWWERVNSGILRLPLR
eukprot:Skav234490  [mRNA]  locus=scaffold3731:121116:128177:+ [translate_table: standard]